MSAVTTSTPARLPGPSGTACCAPSIGPDPTLEAERIATVAKALSEPLRVRVLDVLRRNPEPVCQCELVALFDVKQSLLSHHLHKLAEAGLVDVERRHKWAYYSVSDDGARELTSWLT
jgi:ArsR family transcriptional regulator, arsenate/arsenite/antimonite-responsive transcriptional repressor